MKYDENIKQSRSSPLQTPEYILIRNSTRAEELSDIIFE